MISIDKAKLQKLFKSLLDEAGKEASELVEDAIVKYANIVTQQVLGQFASHVKEARLHWLESYDASNDYRQRQHILSMARAQATACMLRAMDYPIVPDDKQIQDMCEGKAPILYDCQSEGEAVQ